MDATCVFEFSGKGFDGAMQPGQKEIRLTIGQCSTIAILPPSTIPGKSRDLLLSDNRASHDGRQSKERAKERHDRSNPLEMSEQASPVNEACKE